MPCAIPRALVEISFREQGSQAGEATIRKGQFLQIYSHECEAATRN